MTAPVGRVPLTDEQLDDWERWAAGGVAVEDYPSRAVLALVAELRASRAREAELAAERERYEEDRCDLVNDCARAEVERDSARAELSVLRPGLRAAKGRIDKATAILHEWNPRPDLNGDQFAEVRAALTGTAQVTIDGPASSGL